MSIKISRKLTEILSTLDQKKTETTRLMLIPESFVFQEIIKLMRKKDKKSQEGLIKIVSQELNVPKDFLGVYLASRRSFIKDWEAQYGLYYVYDKTDGSKKVIDEDGVYLKIEPGRPDHYYKKLIKQARSIFQFSIASEAEKETHLRNNGHSALDFLEKQTKKAKKSRKQHGYNLKQDLTVYLVCEQSIKETLTTQRFTDGRDPDVMDKDESGPIKHALEYAAEKLKQVPDQIRTIYYEVCRRYQLPTWKDLPHLNRVINS